ncbi:MAG TPA: hypothetical protein VHC22_25715 [Pirellulales bacterium]|nr:hypothetical protein [Pirellulales bacterium]
MSGSPFPSPPEPYLAQPVPAGGASRWATDSVVESLVQMRPWLLLFGVLGFVCCILIMAGSLFAGFLSIARNGSAEGAILFVNVPVGLLYFFPSRSLFRFARHISDFRYTRSTADLEAAFMAQKSFWRFCGILVGLIVSLYVFIIVVAVVVGLVFAG